MKNPTTLVLLAYRTAYNLALIKCFRLDGKCYQEEGDFYNYLVFSHISKHGWMMIVKKSGTIVNDPCWMWRSQYNIILQKSRHKMNQHK